MRKTWKGDSLSFDLSIPRISAAPGSLKNAAEGETVGETASNFPSSKGVGYPGLSADGSCSCDFLRPRSLERMEGIVCVSRCHYEVVNINDRVEPDPKKDALPKIEIKTGLWTRSVFRSVSQVAAVVANDDDDTHGRLVLAVCVGPCKRSEQT